ncbi:MAG: hypothetical protein ACKVOU_12965, partial [Cytophagales bacterium]
MKLSLTTAPLFLGFQYRIVFFIYAVNIKSVIRKIIPFFRNFYFTTGFFLLIWMFFFDANDFISQNRLTEKRKDL